MFWKIILTVLVVLPFLPGCDKDTPRREDGSRASESTSADSSVVSESPVTERPAVRARPFSPTAPPPIPAGPSPTPGLSPTRYADARVGTKAFYRFTPERGGTSYQTIEIVGTDATAAHAHQTVETKKYGQYVQFLDFNRFVEGSPASDQFNPTYQERYIGDRMVTVGSKKLLCRVYETRNGSSIYHTLLCDDVPSRLVQHSDNASGIWKTRLQLIDVRD
jgi:hypothetical protein